MKEQTVILKWNNEANKLLLGMQIKSIRYMTDEEIENMGWTCRPICLLLRDPNNPKKDDIWIYPSMDDEGNNAGALFTTDDDMPVIPVI